MTDATTVTATVTSPAIAPAVTFALGGARLAFVMIGSLVVGAVIGAFVRHENVHKLVRDILTGKDGLSYDYVKVVGLPAILVGLHLSYMSVVLNPEHAFDIQSYGLGMGALIFGIGGGVWVKRATEPDLRQGGEGK